MNHPLLLIQILGQLAWGFICFVDSPHNFILLGVNLALAGVTAVSTVTGDKEEFLFFTVYFALWVIPALFLIYSSVGGLLETLNLALQNAGAHTPSLLDNPLAMSMEMLEDYFISMMIAPAFRLINILFKV